MRVEVKIDQTIRSKKSLKDTFDFIANVQSQIPDHFDDLEGFSPIGPNTYRWRFPTFEGAGIKFTVEFTTRFEVGTYDIKILPAPPAGTTTLEGAWNFSPVGADTQIHFQAVLSGDVPIPFLLKPIADPIIQKEIQKRFSQYLTNVEKKLQ